MHEWSGKGFVPYYVFYAKNKVEIKKKLLRKGWEALKGGKDGFYLFQYSGCNSNDLPL